MSDSRTRPHGSIRGAIGALDLGASSGKAFVAELVGKQIEVREVYRFPNAPCVLAGPGAEPLHCWNLPDLHGHVLASLERAAQGASAGLASFGIDTWGSDIGWLDRDGRVMDHIVTGRDPRWTGAQDEVARRLPPPELFRRTGVRSYPFNQVNQVFWYMANRPGMVGDAAMWLPFNSVLAYLLTGTRFAEYTCLSVSQLLCAGSKEYEPDVMRQLGIPDRVLPRIVEPGSRLGFIRPDAMRSAPGHPVEYVAPATHDTACAFASVSTSPIARSVIVSSGTWYLVGTNVAEPVLGEEARRLGFSNEGGVGCVRLLRNVMGTWPLQELRRQWRDQDGCETSWADIDALALAGHLPMAPLDIDASVFYAPGNMAEAIRQHCVERGLAPPTSRPDLVAALYEGLALKVAGVVRDLRSVTGRGFDEIAIVGGGTRSRVLNQWTADASELPVRPGSPDGTAIGNILVQAAAIGWAADVDASRRMLHTGEPTAAYHPCPHERWRDGLRELDELASRVGPAYA